MPIQKSTTIDFNANDSWGAIRALLARLQVKTTELPAKKEKLHTTINLSKCKYLGPDAAVIIARFVLHQTHLGNSVHIAPPLEPKQLVSYYSHVGLKALMSTKVLPNLPFDTNSVFPVTPLIQLKKATFQDADHIIKLVRAHQNLSVNSEEYLRICVNEVIQNVYDHSKSPIGAIMSARYIASKKEVRVAIADAGYGVCETLKVRYPDTTPTLALQRVTKGHYSAMSRENNMGLGVSNLCAIVVEEHNGDVFIVSDSAAAIRQGKAKPWNHEALDFHFEGTGVFFTLPVTG